MNYQEELKESIRKALPELDMVIGWSRGFDPLHATPHFIRREEDLDKLTVGPLSVHNLATYLPGLRGKKIGIVVKGCDSRSVIELLQENLIDREDITIFGYPCQGVVDQAEISKALNRPARIDFCEIKDTKLIIGAGGREQSVELSEVLADKCRSCAYPNALISDHFAGEPAQKREARNGDQDALAAFEELPLAERFDFWQKEMDRCIRCYACRNACPMCVCRDHCLAESRDPHWLSQEDTVREKWLFQLIHAYHLAGRCTECGECQRACPMDIPLLLLKKKMNKEIKDIFQYEAGVDPEATPPLLSFKAEEENIKEREW